MINFIKKLNNKYFFAAVLAVIVFGLTTHSASAQGGVISSVGKIFGLSFPDMLAYGLSWLFNFGLKLSSYVLALAGSLLNVSISLTLRIKDFVDNSPGIFSTWKAIRDISGMFLIFYLLYAAIQLILGIGNPKWGELIKNIVMAGVLINFSFFFAGLGIDASNIVSVQLYNAIAPANSLNTASFQQANSNITQTGLDGGLSDIFMNSLKIVPIYNVAKTQGSNVSGTPQTGWADTLKIPLVGFTGIIIMLTAAVSFGAAAIAFIARFIILLFLLAFSPIWFLGFISPDIDKYTKQWKDMYKGMLMFMPVYLILMYLALNVLTTTPLFQGAPLTNSASVSGLGAWSSYISIAVNAALVLFLLDLPLIAAASLAGKAGLVLEGAVKGFNTKVLTQKLTKSSWNNTGGRAASKIAQSEGFKNFAAKNIAGEYALKGTRAAGANYEKKLDAQTKARSSFSESLGVDQTRLGEAQKVLRREQMKLSTAQHDLAVAKAAGKPTAALEAEVEAAEKLVGSAKGGVAVVQTARQQTYSTRIGGKIDTNTGLRSGGGSIDTLYMYAARKNKLAAAKIQIPILEKQITQQKDGLKEIRADIKQLTGVIKNTPAGPNGNPPAGTATPVQAKELEKLQEDEVKKIGKINDIEAAIDSLKSIN